MLEGAKRIIELFDDDEFKAFLIQGDHGFGKSSYAHRLIAETYSFKNKGKPFWNWNHFQLHMGFTPEEVLHEWRHKRGRDYCYHWDDAGNWLHSLDFQDPFVKDVGKYMQLVRTDWACVIFSTISVEDISSKIRGLRNAIYIDIVKDGADEDHPYRRTANAYIQRRTTKGRVWKDYQWEDSFDCHVPDDFYAKYKPLRDAYTKIAKENAERKLEERKVMELDAQLRMQRTQERIKRFLDKQKEPSVDTA